MNVLYTMDLSDTSPTATESPPDQTDTWKSDPDRQIPEAPSADDEEGLLSDWTIVVFTLTTTALLFYHMTGEKDGSHPSQGCRLLRMLSHLCCVTLQCDVYDCFHPAYSSNYRHYSSTQRTLRPSAAQPYASPRWVTVS